MYVSIAWIPLASSSNEWNEDDVHDLSLDIGTMEMEPSKTSIDSILGGYTRINGRHGRETERQKTSPVPSIPFLYGSDAFDSDAFLYPSKARNVRSDRWKGSNRCTSTKVYPRENVLLEPPPYKRRSRSMRGVFDDEGSDVS